MAVEDQRFIEVMLEGGEALVWGRGPVGSATSAVVLLHDRAMNARAWDLVVRRLPSETAIIAPDLRGRASAWRLPPSSGIEDHLCDLGLILDQLDIDHVLVVGHGFGAVVGREFSRHAPERAVMTVGVRGRGFDPFQDVLGLGFRDRLEHLRHWEQHPLLADVVEHEGVHGFLDHGIAGPQDHHRWRVDLRSLIADDASAEAVRQGVVLQGAVPHDSAVGSAIEPDHGFRRLILVGPMADRMTPVGPVVHLPDADPVTVVLTPSGADAIAAQIRPLLTG